MQPYRGKAGQLARVLLSALEGHDYAGRSFTTFPEWLETGQLASYDREKGALIAPSQSLSWLMAEAAGMLPQAIQAPYQVLTGQQEFLDAFFDAAGQKTYQAYEKKARK
jgi:hypothetical protein